MRTKILALCLTLLAIAAATASAQTGSGGGANPISQAIKAAWDGAKQNIKESADVMPEPTYGFKPVESVRTFGQILAHIAGANYVFCSAAKGEKPPHAEDEFEKSVKTKTDIAKALDDSLGYCDAVYAGLDDKKAGELIDMPFGMGRSPRAGALMGNTGHLQEHYGNLVTYFRIKRIVPPSSRRQ